MLIRDSFYLRVAKSNRSQKEENANPSLPKNSILHAEEDHRQRFDISIDNDILVKLPKTFQISSSHLAGVREMDGKVHRVIKKVNGLSRRATIRTTNPTPRPRIEP